MTTKALRNLGIHDSVHEHSEPIQFFINSSPKTARPRTRSSTTIWNLPDSVIVDILRGVHVKDFLSFRSVHPYFCDVIHNYQNSLWKSVSFFECWPEEVNRRHFMKASLCGNVEATIKLAVAYLYKEGLSKDDVTKIASEAATYLSLAESLTPDTFPFFWIFIRPPWAPDGSCCKVQAFNHLKAIVDMSEDRDLAFGIALTLKLQRLSVQGTSKSEEQKYFDLAARRNSSAATFFSLLDVISNEVSTAHTGQDYERIRLLRQLSSENILEAKINLVRNYMQGHYGGITEAMAKDYTRQFFTSSKPSGIHSIFLKGPTSDISRYILVDWLVEVVGMKDFSAHTLYLAVSLFDRFLKVRSVQRSKVQLLGVSAMVISSRFLGFDILTIREAAWLTDNSYSYHDVVKMMGELVATLKGNIRVVTIQDFVKILLVMIGETGYGAMLVEYIAMLCLLQSEMGQYSPAEVAASCVLLSRLLLDKADPWPDHLKEWTGYTQDYLSLCTFHIHRKCVLEGSEVDYRDAKLRAVKLRYVDSNRYSVSNVEVIGHRELCRRLGVTRMVNHSKNTKSMRFRNKDELLVSPRRLKKHPEFLRSLDQSFDEVAVDRTNAATPPIKHANCFEANISGYDGDYEEDSDGCMSEEFETLHELTGDSTLDQSTTLDNFNESHEWDSEVSMMEDDPSDSENNNSGLVKLSDKIVCLSSMCHSGNNVQCQAFSTSPSCYVSNCSCQETMTLAGNRKYVGQSSCFSQACAPNSSENRFVSNISSPNSSSLHNSSNNGQPAKKRLTARNCFCVPSSSKTIPTCDNTQSSKICDENGNYPQSLVPGDSPNYDITMTDSINLSNVMNSDAVVKHEGWPNRPFQKAELVQPHSQNGLGPLKNCDFSQATNGKKCSTNTSSFIEISCSTQSNELNPNLSKGDNNFISCRCNVDSAWQRNPSLQSDKSNGVCNYAGTPCRSESECIQREAFSSPNSNPNTYHQCGHSTGFGVYSKAPNVENISFSTETPSSHFMSAKRARLDTSSSSSVRLSEPREKVGKRSCCNSFTDLLGYSRSHQATTGTGSNGGQTFTLPSRFRRKKTAGISST